MVREHIRGYKFDFTPDQLPPTSGKVTHISRSALYLLKDSLLGWKENINIAKAYRLLKMSVAWHEAIIHTNAAPSAEVLPQRIPALVAAEKELTLSEKELQLLDWEKELIEREQSIKNLETHSISSKKAKETAVDKLMLYSQQILHGSDTSIIKSIKKTLESALADIQNLDAAILHKDTGEKAWKIDLE